MRIFELTATALHSHKQPLIYILGSNGLPCADYEQLVLNSNKEGMDFLRKGQYKQGRLERLMLDGIRTVSGMDA